MKMKIFDFVSYCSFPKMLRRAPNCKTVITIFEENILKALK